MVLKEPKVDLKAVSESGEPTVVGDALLDCAGFGAARVSSFEVLGGGNPVMSQVFRVAVEGDRAAPETAIVKMPAVSELDRRREAATGAYAREAEVYRLLRDMQGEFQPRIYSSMYDSPSKLAALLIEDLGPLPRRDDFDVEIVREVLSNLARIHRRYWDDRDLGSHWWMRKGPNADIFNEDTDLFTPHWELLSDSPELHPCDEPEVNRVGDYMTRDLLNVLAQLENRPRTLTHGDLHTANMMFRRDGSAIAPVLIDWQDAVYSGASSDVAKFLSTTLPPNVSSLHFHDLITGYHDELGSKIVSVYPFAIFERDVMLALLGTFANYVIAAAAGEGAGDDPTSINGSLRRVSRNINVLRPLDYL